MHILLTGGTGLIGSHLIPLLLAKGDQVSVVTRNPIQARQRLDKRVTLWSDLQQHTSLDGIDVVINLAGEPIAARRWSQRQKTRLCQSRWQITAHIAALIKASTRPPQLLISGSASGFYGNSGDLVLTEEDAGHQEFTHQLCARWEALAEQAASAQTRVCLLRTGVVLAKSGGALSKMKLPFRLGLGGPLGNGRQYLPWIHIDDMVNAIMWLIDQPAVSGPVNMVAPYGVRNAQFAALLGQAMHRPALVRMPAAALRLLMGESAILLLGGQYLLPKKLNDAGFIFRFRELAPALADVV
ncbi:TIGR01777 family protein [Erwinia sp. OLTSP20]|uniref:TIGR01777 family oxidoreductase n=1 Tax=unclassified Erwinia TaxID=2622719 RepID=UPI000C19A2DB|nr:MULTISPECIES: TIGR01777 family oxidoreductase [unclassified Erwinia]PIJ51498.1 TIGR01777 family protein [Erwinia sp. OAMSP11]PIJ68612.1 TIGR01777 family protein [Erwinia sp. OLSSP12]PIJ83407.1 TIGR01777 family protein [Erwinia sp. OLCASP19]PIJ86240.1 TIGR01777 family protein [Erwinia sp. OLMTSP26]PIJ88517.1 TIGR01777 family protein [Erwinia sp. OLMDSP33]